MLSGALCLLCGVAIGCVEAPGSASPGQIAPLKARLAAQRPAAALRGSESDTGSDLSDGSSDGESARSLGAPAGSPASHRPRARDGSSDAAGEALGAARREARRFRLEAKRLRAKLEPDPSEPKYLVTVRGLGYKLDL